jgi:hypothetical protein
VRWPLTWEECFLKWGKLYCGTFQNKNTFIRFWNTLSKFPCWKICLARNKKIFNGEWSKPSQMNSKEKTLMSKYLRIIIHEHDVTLDNL